MTIPIPVFAGLTGFVFGIWALSIYATHKADQLHDWWNTRQMVMQDEDVIEIHEQVML